ncbi:hypothetical protein P3S68_021834 [Capsicum galapagoense]
MLLSSLSNDPKNTVYIVSERGRSSLSERLVLCERLGIAAKHGYFISDMGKVSPYIVAALIPAVMIAGLYFFHHTIASHKRNSILRILQLIIVTSCSWDLCAPSNGVLPQSPMHTKILAILKRQLIRRRMVKSAKESIKRQASNSEIFVNMQAVFIEIDTSPDTTVAKKLEHLKEAVMRSTEKKWR